MQLGVIRTNEKGRKHCTEVLPSGEVISIHHLNEARSRAVQGSELIHWGMVIAFSNQINQTGKFFREPTYREKLVILRQIGYWKNCAVEVMPRKCEIVDKIDAYHMYEFPSPTQFEFNYHPIFQAPQKYDTMQMDDGLFEYFLRGEDGGLQYLYLRKKNGKELRWWDKQNLKDKIVGAHRCAVEMIIGGMESREYTALIVLPAGRTMDFMLTSN